MLAFGMDAYNASIVAEGVETKSELTTLQGLGCHYGQGYYLGRPAQMSVLPRQMSQAGASPTRALRRSTFDSDLILTPTMRAERAASHQQPESTSTR
jgi:hypothetical protein